MNNPITNVSDALFITKKIEEFVKLHKEVQEEKDKIQRVHWKGLVPYLRFIHCLTDDDGIRSAFITSMTCMTRVELDRKNNEQIRRDDPWEMVANKWNDEGYKLNSCKYPLLHTDFRGSILCDHVDVQEMGQLTAEKAKDRFLKLKMEVVTVRTKWMASGQGEGSLRRVSDNTANDSDSDCSLIDGTCKANFLNGCSPCVLYLWEHAEQYNLIDAVCQQELSVECTFDTSTKGKIKLVSTVRKRKVKDTNMDAMPPGTLQLKTERDFVAQTISNIKQLEELERQIFDLQLLLIDGNVAVGTPKYLLLNK